MGRVLDGLDAIRGHFAVYDLPEPTAVNVCRHGGGVDVQLVPGDVCQLAAELVAWAATLDAPSAEVLRTESTGGRYHLRLAGRLGTGQLVLVYAGCTVADDLAAGVPFAGLAQGERRPVPLAVVGRLAGEAVR